MIRTWRTSVHPITRGPEGTPFEGGVFVTELIFPPDYPLSPPKMKFISEMFHPNGEQVALHHMLCSLDSMSIIVGLVWLVSGSCGSCSHVHAHTHIDVVYQDGRVCISILHTPGDDPLGYETAAERWSPVQSIEKILLSVVSMLAGQWLCMHWWAVTPVYNCKYSE